MTTSSPATPPTRRATAGRILRSIAISVVVLHAAQTFFGDWAWASVLAFGLVAAFVFGLYLDVLKSVRTAVILLVLLSVSCTLGTLTVQRAHVSAASEDEFRQTLSFAWAHLLVKVAHPWPRGVEMPAEHAEHLERMGVAFGADVADEEREATLKGLRAAEDEAAAKRLATDASGLFGGLFHLTDALRLTDLFAAWWFIGLFYLLAANLLVGAVMRRRVSVRNLGFHGAHLGLVLIVLGATVGAFRGTRGMLPLNVGESASRFVQRNPMAALPLGFSVQLDRFETLYHEDLSIEALSASAASDPHHGMRASGPQPLRHSEKLELGKSFTLTDPDSGDSWALTMEEIAEGTALRRGFVPSDAEDAPTAVLVELRETGDGGTARTWISAADPVHVHPQNLYKLRVLRGEVRSTEPDVSVGCPPEGSLGSFVLEHDGGDTLIAPVKVGETVTHEGLSVHFLEVTPDFRVGAAESRETDFPRNPALRARIEGEDGHAGDFLLFTDPRLREFTQLPWDGYDATFDYDYWCSPTGARVQLTVDETGMAAAAVEGEEFAPRTIAEGETIDLLGDTGSLSIIEILPHADVETVLEAGPGATALKLRVERRGRTERQWLLSNTPDGVMLLQDEGADGFALLLADNTDRPPRDWRSHVSFLEEGDVMASGVLEVNRPLNHDGYRFFQSDADARRPEYSGLQVVRDPAWPLVRAGLWMLLLGISWCFYVQPLYDRRRKARAS